MRSLWCKIGTLPKRTHAADARLTRTEDGDCMLVAAVALLVHASAFWNPPACSSCASYSQQTGLSPHTSAVAGTIRDAGGGVVGGATVTVRSGGREQQTVSGPDGRFALNIEAGADAL